MKLGGPQPVRLCEARIEHRRETLHLQLRQFPQLKAACVHVCHPFDEIIGSRFAECVVKRARCPSRECDVALRKYVGRNLNTAVPTSVINPARATSSFAKMLDCHSMTPR